MKKNKNILVFSPHPDDECLGLGGSLAKFVNQQYNIKVCFISGHLPPLYKRSQFEKTKAEAISAMHLIGINKFSFLELPATKINEIPICELNNLLDREIIEFKPEMVFIPFPDRHIDHKKIFEACMVVSRPIARYNFIKLLVAYETLSETHWNAVNIEPSFKPNWFIDITHQIEIKIKALRCYKSQINKNYYSRSLEAVKSLANFRGSQNGFKYAEAFQIIRKIT